MNRHDHTLDQEPGATRKSAPPTPRRLTRNFRQNPSRMALVLGTLVLPTAVSSCGGLDAEADPEFSLTHEDLYGRPSGGASYWNSGTGTPATIPVCWTFNATQNKDVNGQVVPSTLPSITTMRAWTRAASEQSWARAANITFTGWDSVCTRSGQGDDADRNVNGGKIMFAFDTRGDSTDIQGRNPTFGTMIRIATATTDKADYRTTAIHEMGHALGFQHEQDRPDNYQNGVPQTCLSGANGGQEGGTYLNDVGGSSRVDKGSSLCYDSQRDLSRDDIMGVQRLYGTKPSGAVVGDFGECAQASGSAAGSRLVSASCQSSSRISWYFDKMTDGSDRIRSKSNTGSCWAVSSPSASLSTVVADTCGTQGKFSFPSRNMRWRALGDTCVHASSASAGATLNIGGCGDFANERWNFFSPIGYTGGEQVGQIQLTGTNLCVTAPNTTAGMGETPTLATCQGSSSFEKQTFTLTKGTSNVTYKDLCMNVFGGWPDTGATVGFWNGCANSQTQNSLFHLSGSLTSSGKCAYFTGTRGSSLLAGACLAPPAPDRRGLPVRDPQEWDIYW